MQGRAESDDMAALHRDVVHTGLPDKAQVCRGDVSIERVVARCKDSESPGRHVHAKAVLCVARQNNPLK